MLRYLKGTDLLCESASLPEVTICVSSNHRNVDGFGPQLTRYRVSGGCVELMALIEVGIGIVASSIPSIRRLFKEGQGAGESSSVLGPRKQVGLGRSFITFGSMPIRDKNRMKLGDSVDGFTLTTIEAHGGGDVCSGWEQQPDQTSERELILDSQSLDGIRTERSCGYHVDIGAHQIG